LPHRAIGSVWGKWELHFHTPASFDYKNKRVTNSEIVEALKKHEIEVVAITDHHVIDVDRIKALQDLAGTDLTVLPGIEFRSELGGKEKVHLIGIFPEDCNTKDIWTKLCGKLGLTPSDVKAKGGDESVYVDFKHAASVIRECGGIVSVHAGAKSNTIEGIGNNEKYKMALKTDLARDFIDLFEVGHPSDCKAYEEIVFPTIGFVKPLVIGSDNHDIHVYAVPHPCWIKGDPSFRTFQQLKSEPSRARAGSIPEELERINANRTRYISMVEFKKLTGSTLNEDWFSGQVPINHGLVAIIGNKGSGKTALAETIGLLGNCELTGAFSFLNEKKFRQHKNNKAKEFRARLTWHSGHQVIRSLNDPNDESEPRSVSYIPQNYLETICNEINNEPGSQFDKELKSVIFSHVEDDKKLSASSLDQLLAFTNEPIEARIEALRGELHGINLQILGLKEQGSPQQRQLLLNLSASKERELEALDKNKPTEVAKPGADPQKQAELEIVSKQIESKNSERAQAAQAIKDSEALKKVASTQIACAARVTQTLKNFQATHRSLIETLRRDCEVLGINPETLVSIATDFGPVSNASETAGKVSIEQDNAIIALTAKSEKLKQESEELTRQLDAPNSAYQQYLEVLRQWSEQRDRITGGADAPDTIAYLKRRVEDLDKLPEQIAEAEKSRGLKVGEIYENVAALLDNYKRLYQPVQDFIDSHPIANKQFKLDFNASIFVTDIESQFLDKINQGRRGTFCGLEEGKSALSALVASADLQSMTGATKFANDLLDRLERDYRTSAKSKSVFSEQLKIGVGPAEVLDHIFGLKYLVPKYELRWSGKDLDELSPGERGTLLLIFYLLIDRRDTPLIIDQPEENLDNQTVYDTLVPCLREARKRRQVIVVTHNPNLAVVCDADQIIHAEIDKKHRNKVTYTTGSIENPKLNLSSITVLEGTRPAFDQRDAKYQA
jgi:ABC-type lipoprotein export system ATPase subunit